MADTQCPCVCRFCQVYELGVYLVNGTWLAVMIIVGTAYYSELKAYFRGRLKLLAEPSQAPVKIESADAISIIPAGGSDQEPQTNVAAQKLPRAEALQAQIQVKSLPLKALATPTPQAPPTIIDIPQPSPVPIKEPVADKFALPKLSPSISPIVPNKLTRTQARRSPGLKHESTGSGYFNTMMDGKKPVASISQYLLMQKQAKDQRQKEDKHRENRNKEDKQKDDQVKEEKKKGKKDRKRPAQRSDERERKKVRERKREKDKQRIE